MRLDGARRSRVHGASRGVDCRSCSECTRALTRPESASFPPRIVGIVGRHMSLGVYPDQLPIRDLWVIRGEPEIRKALGQVLASPKPRLPAIPRTRAHLSPEAYPRSSYALHTCIHLSLNPLSPERDSNDPLDTSTAARRMDGSMLRRGDENRAVTPGKAMRAVRHPPSRVSRARNDPCPLVPNAYLNSDVA